MNKLCLLLLLLTGFMVPAVAQTTELPALASLYPHFGIYEKGAQHVFFGRSTMRYFLYNEDTRVYYTLVPNPDNTLHSIDTKDTIAVQFVKDEMEVVQSGHHTTFAHTNAYTTTNLVINNGDIHLAGTLWKPTGQAVSPLVILVHGSGQETRDGMRGYPYWFVEHGYAVFTYDKRGSGESNGHYESWYAGIGALAGDVIAIADSLSHLPGINPRQISLMGISNGAAVITKAAAMKPMFRRIVPVVGSFVRVRDQELYRMHNLATKNNVAAGDIKDMERTMNLLYSKGVLDPLNDSLATDKIKIIMESSTGKPWLSSTILKDFQGMPFGQLLQLGRASWKNELGYDPTEDLDRLICPVFSILGEEDVTNPTNAIIELIAGYKKRDLWPQVSVSVIPGVGHFLESRDAYGNKVVPKEYWETLEKIFVKAE